MKISPFILGAVLLSVVAVGVQGGWYINDNEWTSQQSDQRPISMEINCYRPLRDVSKVSCSFDFTNIGTRDLYLLKRDTPLEGLSSPFLSLSFEGHPIEYEGIIVHRTHVPEKDEFVLLRAGETLSATPVDITEAFSINRDGVYTVEYTKPLHYMYARWGKRLPLWFNVKTIIQDVDKFNAARKFPIYLESTYLLKKPPTGNNENQATYTKDVVTEVCDNVKIKGGTAEQRKTVCDIHKVIVERIESAANCTKKNKLTETYFGTYDKTRYDTVKNNFEKMADKISGLTNETIAYDLTCDENKVAFVRGKKLPAFYCKWFWGKVVSAHKYCKGLSKASQEGTIVHEWSHLYAKTSDIVYGAKQSRDLAKKTPSDAIKNADSYTVYYCLAQKNCS